MDIFQLLLLGSILIPTVSSLLILLFFLNDAARAKQIAYIGFGVPCIAGILLFLNFDP